MRSFFREFKDFIVTGNMIELAVALILGLAIAAAITAFTNGIMMQIVAAIFGQPDFSNITITLREDVNDAGDDAVLQIGAFINALIVLVLTGLVLFLIVKAYNKLKKAEPETVAPTDVEVLMEIRDELRAQRANR